jgi:nitroreductase
MPPKDDENEPGMTEILHLLSTRRSVPPVSLTGPGPSADEISTLLKIAARVPDHGKLAPWRFIVFQGEARERAGQIVAEGFKRRDPQADDTRIAAEAKRMTMAPLIIGVVSTAKDGANETAQDSRAFVTTCKRVHHGFEGSTHHECNRQVDDIASIDELFEFNNDSSLCKVLHFCKNLSHRLPLFQSELTLH